MAEPEPVRVVKRSVSIAGHRTSVSLEDAFWTALKEIAREDGTSLAGTIARVDDRRGAANLSSALRVHVLERMRRKYLLPSGEGGRGAAG